MHPLIIRGQLLLIFLLLTLPIQAQAMDARSYIQQITGELETALKAGKDNGQLQDRAFLDSVIDRHIIPHVDQEQLSKRIFQPRWDEIVAAGKREQAYQAVLQSLRRTYRIALASYNGQTIELRDSQDKPKYSVVRVYIRTSDDGHLIDFALRQVSGQWRVFDLSVDGVVVSKTLNGAIKQSLQTADLDSLIGAINPSSKP
ncbi:Tgt2/MlaC family protein [Marinobacterium arenosum]|uniref:Tgt2/MlaC family protein n=1 Tax=Marinobacterium arenosum TaxID=2862496 RepID=UPI001C97BBCC|nr:ABC transporter substrate-binding protein [Marinobacterium arenosum]MBY4677709.1 ABC transporter substrate-binding protein [Marinobacterium arenosum]